MYDATRFLITSVDPPVVADIIEASSEKPYPDLILEIDLKEISQLTADSGLPVNRSGQAQIGMAVGQLSLPLIDTSHRPINLPGGKKNIKSLCYSICPKSVTRITRPLTDYNHPVTHTSRCLALIK